MLLVIFYYIALWISGKTCLHVPFMAKSSTNILDLNVCVYFNVSS